ncbi:MAG: copper amine oxidase N-terminal domain-containing protein [Sedimentibacter sp.]
MNWKKSRTLIVICIITALLLGNFAAYAQETSTIKITLNGKSIDSDVNPYINDESRTMVELRSIAEALGATLTWDSDTKTVTIIKDTSIFTVVIGELQYTLDENINTMDTVASIVDGRTMVPVRFITEALGLVVNWDSTTSTVIITSENTDVQGSPKDGGTIDLESIFTPYVESGIITESEMEELIAYLEENAPEQNDSSTSQTAGPPTSDTEERPELLDGAVDAGIITQDQADAMDINIGQPAGGQGMGPGQGAMER